MSDWTGDENHFGKGCGQVVGGLLVIALVIVAVVAACYGASAMVK